MSLLLSPKRMVPRYFLYGEMPRQAAPGFVHIERLSLRSARHGWEIAPHLHEGLVQAFWIAEGAGQARLDTERAEFTGPALLIIPAGLVHAFAYTPASEGLVLTLATDYVAGLAASLDPALGAAFTAPGALSLTAAEAEAHGLDAVFTRLEHELEFGHTGMPAAVAALVQLLMVAVTRLRPHAQSGAAAGAEIWQAYRAAVEQQFRVLHGVAELASNLPVTRGRLDAICRRHGGRSAQQVIHDRLVLEAQRGLIYTGQTVAAIAYDLGFADPAYFTRFFTRETGEAPVAFRKRHRAAA